MHAGLKDAGSQDSGTHMWRQYVCGQVQGLARPRDVGAHGDLGSHTCDGGAWKWVLRGPHRHPRQRQHACGWVGALTELTNSPLGMRFRDCVFRALRIVHWHSQRTILRDRVGILGISWASPSNPLTSGSGNLNLFVYL